MDDCRLIFFASSSLYFFFVFFFSRFSLFLFSFAEYTYSPGGLFNGNRWYVLNIALMMTTRLTSEQKKEMKSKRNCDTMKKWKTTTRNKLNRTKIYMDYGIYYSREKRKTTSMSRFETRRRRRERIKCEIKSRYISIKNHQLVLMGVIIIFNIKRFLCFLFFSILKIIVIYIYIYIRRENQRKRKEILFCSFSSSFFVKSIFLIWFF